jgi:hypothetical protein
MAPPTNVDDFRKKECGDHREDNLRDDSLTTRDHHTVPEPNPDSNQMFQDLVYVPFRRI